MGREVKASPGRGPGSLSYFPAAECASAQRLEVFLDRIKKFLIFDAQGVIISEPPRRHGAAGGGVKSWILNV